IDEPGRVSAPEHHLVYAAFRTARKKISGLPFGSPANQAYLRVPSIPSVAWQPYPSPPRDGQEPIALRPRLTTGLPLSGKESSSCGRLVSSFGHTSTVEHGGGLGKLR